MSGRDDKPWRSITISKRLGKQAGVFLVLIMVGAVIGMAVPNYLSNSVDVSGGVTFAAPSGPAVNLTGSTDVNATNVFRGSDTVVLNTSHGNVTLTSPGPTNASIAATEINGSWTNVTNLDVSSNELQVDPEDKPAFNVSGNTDRLSVPKTIKLDDGKTDFVYAGTSGTTSVTLRGLPANETVAAVDADTTEVLDGSTTTSDGVLVLTDMPNSEHTVELKTSDGGTPELSNPQPEGTLSEAPTNLSIDVDDPDFPDDNVTVTFYLDGQKVGTDSLSSAGTAQVSISEPSRGEHDVRAVANDSYDLSNDREWTFGVPNTIYLKNETTPSQNLSVPVNVTFYTVNGEQIFTRNTSNGELNMTGLPGESEYIVALQPQDGGYADRTVFIDDIARQQTLYLLNTTAITHSNVRFTLTDPTGQYPKDETVLYVQRAINESNTTTWVTVAGDQFGVEGTTVNLETDERYRLVVENFETNSLSVLGSFTPVGDETVELTTGAATIEFTADDVAYDWSAEQRDTSILFEYEDRENKTEILKLTIHERYNASNVLVSNATFYDLGTLSYSEPLTPEQQNMTWTGIIYIDRGDGAFTEYRVPIGGGPIDLIPSNLDPVWRNAIGVFVLFISSMIYSELNQGIGAVATSLTAALLWYIGLLALVTTGPAVVIAIAVSVVYQHRKGGGVF